MEYVTKVAIRKIPKSQSVPHKIISNRKSKSFRFDCAKYFQTVTLHRLGRQFSNSKFYYVIIFSSEHIYPQNVNFNDEVIALTFNLSSFGYKSFSV